MYRVLSGPHCTVLTVDNDTDAQALGGGASGTLEWEIQRQKVPEKA